jgi:hypothetical protein
VNASSPKLTAEEAHRTPLQTIFSEMPSHLNTAKAAGQSHVVEFRFPGCDPSLDPVTTFGVVVENGRVQPFFGENQLPRPATLLAKMDRNYYKEIALGATEPGAEAFFKIKMIQGKLFELAAFNGLFETPPTSPHA